MSRQFHPFPRLPWELREKIWKFAVRPALPGAHVFTVYDANDLDYADSEHTLRCNTSWWISGSRLAAPKCLPRGIDLDSHSAVSAPNSWTLNNPSTYLIDSGLWTACKESLLIIQKEFQHPARRGKGRSAAVVKIYRDKGGRFTPMGRITFPVSEDAKCRHLTVFPGQDLFILQPNDIAAVDWEFIWDVFPHDTFVVTDLGGLAWVEPERHMALEYNPEWDRMAHNEHRRVFLGGPEAVLYFEIAYNTAQAGPFTLWFIDYRIKRNARYQEPAQEQAKPKAHGGKSPRVFYARDRRFVEVEEKQLGRWTGHDLMWDAGTEVPTKDDCCTCCGAGAYVKRLMNYMETRWGYGESYGHPSRGLGWVQYGILACEYLG
ncbi:uncharacterized protein C8A04DRAFT_37259 [Dichotomopilus funicola]|uniref:2EXR domain-containing protein n=1 Tax=Dichotomopilus funicola TaxID=1934379 RepID=A0AAN6V2E6_9PEZI|nr:hypothetical protein C8A04DRAFT_37259 [Dichotomopilus funicola]